MVDYTKDWDQSDVISFRSTHNILQKGWKQYNTWFE